MLERLVLRHTLHVCTLRTSLEHSAVLVASCNCLASYYAILDRT